MKTIWWHLVAVAAYAVAVAYGDTIEKKANLTGRRNPHVFGLFSIVNFPNSFCVGSTKNGTCYTSSECSAKGGSSQGSCASSFGVCCTFDMSCGSTTSENVTYHTITTFSSTTDSSPCTYTICPTNSDVCKLRIDFVSFTIAAPITPITEDFATAIAITSIDVADNAASEGIGPLLGDCRTDTFQVISPGNQASPIICGKNAGQHLYVDVKDCADLTFDIGTGSTSVTRSWELKVLQIECGNRLADHECLQYHTGTLGEFRSFNFDPSITSTSTIANGDNVQHLSNQYYTVCFRREENYCSICFSPIKQGIASGLPAIAVFGSFGVSASSNANAAGKGGNELSCYTAAAATPFASTGEALFDYIEVNGLVPTATPTAAQSSTGVQGAIGAIDLASKTCGSVFVSDDSISSADATLCSYRVPFRWGVNFDGGEVAITVNPATSFNTAEQTTNADQTLQPNGMIGFAMAYWQVSC